MTTATPSRFELISSVDAEVNGQGCGITIPYLSDWKSHSGQVRNFYYYLSWDKL